jgi:putative addiction module component (TIGR02574 family)
VRALAQRYAAGMVKETIPQLAQLSSEQKLALVDELLDEVAAADDLPLPDWQKRELDACAAEYVQDPTEGSSWEDARERILRRLQ